MTPEETRARLLYRDGLMLILDKPAGIAVHKGPKGGESLEVGERITPRRFALDQFARDGLPAIALVLAVHRAGQPETSR